jgi:hypothetical protein
MAQIKPIEEYQTLIAGFLRSCDIKRAKGNETQIREFQAMNDQDVMRRWMWVISIIGGPLCFLVTPLIISILSAFVPLPILSVFWVLAKVMMGMIFILFALAIYFTVNQTRT